MAGLGTQRKGTRAAIHQECKIKIVDVGSLGLFDFVRNPSVQTVLQFYFNLKVEQMHGDQVLKQSSGERIFCMYV